MNIVSAGARFAQGTWSQGCSPRPPQLPRRDPEQLREAFQSFVGQTFFGQMLKAMRKTVGKPAYVYGGRTEEIFQQQLDQVLAEKMAEASAPRLAEPMFELFTMKRQ